MRRRVPALLFLVLATVLGASLAGLAHEGHGDEFAGPPHGASLDLDGPVGLWAWTSPSSANATGTSSYEPGDEGAVQVTWRDMPGGGNATYNATFSVAAPANVTLQGQAAAETGNVTGNDTGGPHHAPMAFPFALDEGLEGTRTLTVNVTVYEANTTERNTTNGTTNVTTWEPVHETTLDHEVTVKAPAQPPSEGPPWLLIGGLVAAGAAAAGGAVVYKRRQGPRAPRRSQALQELEAEDDEEARQQVQEQRTQQRKTREMRILEAKAEDHREGIERARQRLEEGEITEHQFDRIKERKEEALEDVLEKLEEKRQDLED